MVESRYPGSRPELAEIQLRRLNKLLAEILPANAFYREKFGVDSLQLDSLIQLSQMPMTTKSELVGAELVGTELSSPETVAQHSSIAGHAGTIATNSRIAPPIKGLGRHHTWPIERYARCHRTSGTSGRPMVILDTAEDWQWWLDTWQYVLDAAHVTADDRVLMAFSFGPFIGFWSAHEACLARGATVIPAGGLSTIARLEWILDTSPTVICCTPSYAIYLAEVAQQQSIDLTRVGVRRFIVAGEPGGSSAETRQRIANSWGAEVTDHAGATEIGPWGYGAENGGGLHIIESEFIAEFLPMQYEASENPAVGAVELPRYELVLTSLGRSGCPVIRYRTGDVVCPIYNDDPFQFVRLEGGVLGRTDDMLIVRGVNVFPSSIESILRSFPEVAEFRILAGRRGSLDELTIEVEDAADQPERIAKQIEVRLGLRVNLTCVPLNSLPRFEGKGRRFVDRR